jgi:hypothetical protein
MELEKSLENFVNSLEKVLKSKNKTVGGDQQSEEKSAGTGTSVVELVDGSKEDEKPKSQDDDTEDSLITFEGDDDLEETKSSVNEDHQSDVDMAEMLNDGDTISIADGETLSALTTPRVSGIVTPASSAGSPKEIAQEPEAVSSQLTEVSEDFSQRLGEVEAAPKVDTLKNIPKTLMPLAVEKDEVDGSSREASVEMTGNIDNQEHQQSQVSSVTDTRQEEKESQSNVCDTNNSATCPKSSTEDENINLLDREIKQEQIEENSLAMGTNVQSPNKCDEVVDLTVEKSVSFLLSSPTKGLITPQKSPTAHLSDNRFLPGFIRPYPKDFNAVRIKLINEEYSSVVCILHCVIRPSL